MHGRFKIMRLGQNLGAVAVRRRPGGIWDPGSPSAATGGVVRIWDPATDEPLTSLRVAGRLFHLILVSTTIAAAGERGLYFLTLCR